MNSTDANDRMISVEIAVRAWRSGGIDSEDALERVRKLVVSTPGERPAFNEPRYDKPLG